MDQRVVRAVKGADEIRPHDRLVIERAGPLQRSPRADAGVVDPYIEAAEGVDRPAGDERGILIAGHIGPHRHHLDAQFPALTGQSIDPGGSG